jgi:hypothetical protein
VSDQVSHSYKTIDRIVALYILIRILLKPYKMSDTLREDWVCFRLLTAVQTTPC